MKVHRLVMPAILIVTLLGTVQVANLLGYWQTSGQELVDLTNLKAADIKGWMTLEQVALGTQIPLPDLLVILGLPADTPGATPMKDLEDIVDVDTARTKISDYLGQPASPGSASQPTATLDATVAPTAVGTPKTEATRTPAPAGQLAPADIKGTMTLREVSTGTGLPLDKLLAEAKLPADTSPDITLKDLVAKIPGLEIQTVRDAATRLLGQ
jgi:hypothetical protein